ncbi:hypothetical protein NDU88_002442 [Pleurodeles waltl]|uniref:Uncharacterized protein n=1 Tax=Pleurodeles waltl TaxID=8319 RepID=A0AAV7MRG3_PLEWA|nr:hypothetical protein NDU88_002442 [Pleurodeles waltl]
MVKRPRGCWRSPGVQVRPTSTPRVEPKADCWACAACHRPGLEAGRWLTVRAAAAVMEWSGAQGGPGRG